MTNRDVISPTGRSKSYIANLPTSAKRNQKESRKTSVKDSLMKFLDDCGNEDLIINAANSPPKRTALLSMSEHGPSNLSKLQNDATTKRRGTKKDRLDALSPSSDHGERRMISNAFSEHGTPSTQKASLNSLKIDVQIDEGSESSSDGSFAADEGETPLDIGESPKRRQSSSRAQSRTRSSSTRSSKDRTAGSRSTRMQRSKSDRESNRSVRSERSTGRTRDMRRTKSDSQSTSSRTKTNNMNGRSLDKQLSSIDRQTSSRRRRGGTDDDNRSVSSSRSSFSTMSGLTGKSLGLDAGPLNAFLNAERRPSMNATSSASVGPGIAPSHHQDEKFLKLRKERQDEILSLAQKDRWNSQKSSAKSDDNLHASSYDGIPDGDDDDQPMVKGKSSAFARLRKGISKTGQVTKNTAKGTVNVVMDPKRAAKKVGVFAKDVGKETGKMLMDPKLAAMTAVSLGKEVTVGTYKVTKGVGKGVAKGGIGLTKSVAKSGVNATSMVVGTALDGAGKVMTGASGLIFKSGNGERDEQYVEYKASELESRRRSGSSLLDRVANPMSTSESSEQNGGTDQSARSTRIKNHGVPTLLVSNGNKDSWDF